MLFDPKYADESITVIPIVGFGGLGKTTLAQLVFNDERVKDHFDVAKWACVPEINDHNEVLGKILSALTDRSCQGVSREQIQSQIRGAVKDKKFLLVLDDIWDESRKVIVTTRSGVVATIVGTVPEAYKLGLLTQEESWNLFKILAFKNGQEESNPALVQIGKEIVGNCGNVPLAIRKDVSSQIIGLTSVQELTIIGCPKLISLWESLRGITSLQKLKIIECPDLQKRCQQPDGQDWPLIRHIPTISFQLYP